MKKYLRLPFIPVAVTAAAFFIAGLSAKTSLELFLPFLLYLVTFSALLLLLKLFTKNNPIALPIAIFATLLINEIIFLGSQSYWYYKLNGAILAVILLLTFAALARKPKPTYNSL
jgi:hypothetical protein